MEDRLSLNGNWQLYYCAHINVSDPDVYVTSQSLESSDLMHITGKVPGNFEIDLEREGIIDDIFYGTNVLEAQNRENYHLWYIKKFSAFRGEYTITFEGIDTVADIYINGKLAGSVKNMLIEHKFDVALEYDNEIVVHIKPVILEEMKSEATAGAVNHQPYTAGSLTVRKAAHMYGWDIMPRVLSGGIWKSVYLQPKQADKIEEVYLRTIKLYENRAKQLCYYKVRISGDLIHEYSLRITGKCKDSEFYQENRLWGASGTFMLFIENPELWWIRDLGEQNLYDVKIELLRKGVAVDTKKVRLGVRTFALERSSTVNKDGGRFQFYINGEKLFIRGTNWVPLDALHSRDKKRLPSALELLFDIGCNAVRMWGGNVYENDEFFDFCDEKGIAVWQDFGMGCAVYPNTPEMLSAFSDEAQAVVKRLRHHPSLMLWAGDNECDEASAVWTEVAYDPNKNLITRNVFPYILKLHDPERIYLPSSPYIDEHAFNEGRADDIPEKHLWGPRDCFKGRYYTDAKAVFASETGYHGSVSRESALKFISPEKLWPPDNNEEWLVHASCMEAKEGAPYSYRIPLMLNQIKVLFGEDPVDFDRFSAMSAASQAEAMKFFVERFRTGKVGWKRTGIIWWNLIDGWPQFSDAVVDYYFGKKPAYYAIKASQHPLCIMMKEPVNGTSDIVCANEYGTEKEISYSISSLTENKTVAEGIYTIPANTAEIIKEIPVCSDRFGFFVMKWRDGEKEYKNYYASYTMPVDFDTYNKYMTMFLGN